MKTELGAWRVQHLETLIEGIQCTQIVASTERGNKIMGVVSVQSRGLLCALITRLYVAPAFQLQGIGRQLVNECIVIATEHLCRAISLTIAECNRTTVFPFWARLGFHVAYEFQDKTILMTRKLP